LRKNSPSKVFIGYDEIANVSSGMAIALRSCGIRADFVTFSTSKHTFGYKTDRELFLFEESPVKGLNTLMRLFHFIRVLISYNTYIFLSPTSLLNRNRDLPILKFLGKKVIFIFTGCNERDPAFDLTNPDFICSRCKDENWQKLFLCKEPDKKKKKIQNLEKCTDRIIAAPDTASYLVNKNTIWPFIVAERPAQKDYMKKFEAGKIIITHLPSNPLVKQSHIIVPILEKISALNNVEVIIKDGQWVREKILSVLDKTHILVDALGLGYGMLGVEAMSRGCLVMNSFDKWFRENVPDAPIYPTSAKTLYNDLIYLISNPDIMRDYAKRSIDFYNKYHSPEAAGKYYKDKLELN
jgi:hypothetical protein